MLHRGVEYLPFAAHSAYLRFEVKDNVGLLALDTSDTVEIGLSRWAEVGSVGGWLYIWLN